MCKLDTGSTACCQFKLQYEPSLSVVYTVRMTTRRRSAASQEFARGRHPQGTQGYAKRNDRHLSITRQRHRRSLRAAWAGYTAHR